MPGAVCAFAVFSVRAGVLASWGHPDLPRNARRRRRARATTATCRRTAGVHADVRRHPGAARPDRQGGEGIRHWATTCRSSSTRSTATRGRGRGTCATTRASRTRRSARTTRRRRAPMLFISKQSATNVNLGDAYNEGVPYHHRRWFPEEYRGADGKYSTSRLLQRSLLEERAEHVARLLGPAHAAERAGHGRWRRVLPEGVQRTDRAARRPDGAHRRHAARDRRQRLGEGPAERRVGRGVRCRPATSTSRTRTTTASRSTTRRATSSRWRADSAATCR